MSSERTPLDAFIEHKTTIDNILQRLQKASDDHFDVLPDEIGWGHAALLSEIMKELQHINDRMFNEGEYAQAM